MSFKEGINLISMVCSSKKGVKHWFFQRVSALLLIPFVLWFLYSLLSASGTDYVSALVWFDSTTNTVLMLLFIIFLYYHLALGIQNIIEDYISSKQKRSFFLIIFKLVACFFCLSALVSVLIIYMRGY